MAILGKPFDPDNAARILSPFSASSPSNSVLGQSRALGAPFVRRPRGSIPQVPIAPGYAPQRPDSPRAIDQFQIRPATPRSVLTEPVRRSQNQLQAYEGSPQAYSNQLLADAFDPREDPSVQSQLQEAFGLKEFYEQNQTSLMARIGPGTGGVTVPGTKAYIPRGVVDPKILRLAEAEGRDIQNQKLLAAQLAAQQATGQPVLTQQQLMRQSAGQTLEAQGAGLQSALDNAIVQPGQRFVGRHIVPGSEPIQSPSNEPSAISGGGGVAQLTPQQQAVQQDVLGKVAANRAAEPKGDLGMPEIQYLDASKGEFKNTPVAQTVLTPDKIYAEPAGAPSLSAEDIASLESAGVKYADYQNIMNTAKSSGTDTFSGAIDSLNQTMAAYKAAVASGKDSVAIAKLGRAIQQGMAGLTSAQAKYSAHQTKVAQDAAALAATNQRDPTQVTQ